MDYFYNLGRFKKKKGLGEQFRKQAIAQKIEQEKGKGRESSCISYLLLLNQSLQNLVI